MQVNQVFTLAEMDACFELIQQLQPWLKKEKYLESLAQMIQHNYSQLIVNDEYGNPIGVSGVWINYKLYCGKYLEMDNVVVDEKHRNQGIGDMLYEKALEIATNEHCRVMMLDAYLENHAGHRFYERKDFVKKGFHFVKSL